MRTNDNIEGIATVTYTSVDNETLSALRSIGVAPGDCSQQLYLLLGYQY